MAPCNSKKESDLGFPITQEEHDAIEAWKRQHEDAKHGGYPAYRGAVGGGYNYIFNPTSIGTYGTVQCSCGEVFVFRDL